MSDDQPLNLALDEEPEVDRHAVEPVRWGRLLLAVGAAAALVFATATVVNDRRDAQIDEAAAREMNLVVGEMRNESTRRVDGLYAGYINIFNAGERDVEVLSAIPTSWDPGPSDDRSYLITAGSWGVVPLRGRPDCGTTPTELNLLVSKPTGEREAELVLSPEHTLNFLSRELCTEPSDQIWLQATTVETLTRRADELVARHVVEMFAVHTLQVQSGTTLIGVTSEVAGFSSELRQPVDMRPGRSEFDVVWRVTDCAEAATFDEGGISYETEGGSAVESENEIPTALVAALVRLAIDVCGEGDV